MTVPTPTFSSNDLSDTGTWTAVGDPQFVPDDWSIANVAGDLDGFQDRFDGPTVISNGATKASGTMWVQRPSVQVRTEVLSSQMAAFNDPGFKFFWLINDFQMSVFNPSGGGSRSSSSAPVSHGVIGEWLHLGWSVEALGGGDTDIRLYFNGVEGTYSAKDVRFGTGFDSFQNTEVLKLGFATGEGTFTGQMSRPRIWDNIILTPAEMLEEFNNEAAAKLLSDTLTERLNAWEVTDPGLARVNTLIEPFELGTTIRNAGSSGQILTTGQIKRLNEWGDNDPALSVIGNSVTPTNFGDLLDELMGVPPFATVLTDKQIEAYNDWELSDPALANVESPEEPFNLGDTLNTLLTRA